MRNFVLVIFWLEAIGFVVTIACLGLLDYPRVVKWSRGEDAFKAVLKAALAFCLGYMLWAST